VLINRDVPQHVVQKILDHDSPAMTGHYARLSDKTVREHWEKARKVNAEVILSFRVSRSCDLRYPVVDSVADGTLAA
jgi:hypothetical protein